MWAVSREQLYTMMEPKLSFDKGNIPHLSASSLLCQQEQEKFVIVIPSWKVEDKIHNPASAELQRMTHYDLYTSWPTLLAVRIKHNDANVSMVWAASSFASYYSCLVNSLQCNSTRSWFICKDQLQPCCISSDQVPDILLCFSDQLHVWHLNKTLCLNLGGLTKAGLKIIWVQKNFTLILTVQGLKGKLLESTWCITSNVDILLVPISLALWRQASKCSTATVAALWWSTAQRRRGTKKSWKQNCLWVNATSKKQHSQSQLVIKCNRKQSSNSMNHLNVLSWETMQVVLVCGRLRKKNRWNGMTRIKKWKLWARL